MENKVEETGMERFRKLQKEAKAFGSTGLHTAEELEAFITQAKAGGIVEPVAKIGITAEEAQKIEARLKYEFEIQEKFKLERKIQTDRATIIAESETLKIKIDLPETPTELELAKARLKLGIEKTEIKPSPETVAIEKSKRGYYVFTNLEQDDASHTVNPGGKYVIHLIPDQIHVLSEAHIKLFKKFAVTPVYKRVSTGVVGGPDTTGKMGEVCKKVGSKPRFLFEYLGEASMDEPFGLVTNIEILEKLSVKEEQLI